MGHAPNNRESKQHNVSVSNLTCGENDLDYLVNMLLFSYKFISIAVEALDAFCDVFFRCDYQALLAYYRQAQLEIDQAAAAGLEVMKRQAWCKTMPTAVLVQTVARGAGLADAAALQRLLTLTAQLSASQGHRAAEILAKNGLQVLHPWEG